MRLLLTSVFLLTFAAATEAQVVGGRQVNQQKRIAEGVKEGEVSRAEAAKLQKQQRQIQRQTRRDRRDGDGFTAAERAKAHRKLNRSSRNIERAKEN